MYRKVWLFSHLIDDEDLAFLQREFISYQQATFEATKRWTTTIRNWGQVYGELSIMYEGRLPE